MRNIKGIKIKKLTAYLLMIMCIAFIILFYKKFNNVQEIETLLTDGANYSFDNIDYGSKIERVKKQLKFEKYEMTTVHGQTLLIVIKELAYNESIQSARVIYAFSDDQFVEGRIVLSFEDKDLCLKELEQLDNTFDNFSISKDKFYFHYASNTYKLDKRYRWTDSNNTVLQLSASNNFDDGYAILVTMTFDN